jgi:hypothetical protein
VLFLNLWVFNLDQAGDVALKVPENYTVTSADLVNHPVLSALAAGNISFLLTTPISIHPVPKSYITWRNLRGIVAKFLKKLDACIAYYLLHF